MKITSTIHNHSTLCDGKSPPEQMINTAIAAGFADFGFSGHSYAPFDLAYSIKDEAAYIRAIRSLQSDYQDKIRIACGLEEDFFAPAVQRDAFDYIIGSVHYFHDPQQNLYYAVDGSADEFERAVEVLFSGDAMAAVRDYYANVVNESRRNPDVIGHFDLVIKNNPDQRFFDRKSREYQQTALAALQECMKSGAVFEINTGAISRGTLDIPYPEEFLLYYLYKHNADILLSADCHDAAHMLTGLNDAALLLKDIGFQHVVIWEDGNFIKRLLKDLC